MASCLLCLWESREDLARHCWHTHYSYECEGGSGTTENICCWCGAKKDESGTHGRHKP